MGIRVTFGTLLYKIMSSFLMFFLFLFVFTFPSVHATDDEDALRECGNLHRTDMHNIVDARAVYSNNKCMLTCFAGTKTLSTHPLNEGYVCDPVSQRKCHDGHCSGDTVEAVHECGNLHRLDLTQYLTNGTEYSADQCTLKCVIDGKVASVNPVNEGLVCVGAVQNGICRKGSCVFDSTQNPTVTTIVTTIPTTVPSTITTMPTKATTNNTTPTPAPINLNSYRIGNITFIIKEAILKEALSSTDSVSIFITSCQTENVHPKASKLVWNQNCKWTYSGLTNLGDFNSFFIVVNNSIRASQVEYTYTLFHKHLLAQPNSVAQHKLEFEEVVQLLDRHDFTKIVADLYVEFTINFHEI